MRRVARLLQPARRRSSGPGDAGAPGCARRLRIDSVVASSGNSSTSNGLRCGIPPVYPAAAAAPPIWAIAAAALDSAPACRPLPSCLHSFGLETSPSPGWPPAPFPSASPTASPCATGPGPACPSAAPSRARPADFGLAFETVSVTAGATSLAGWWIPADGSGKRAGEAREPAGVVILHGWESNRGRSLAHVRYLHAAGFHCLAIDARGHGDNPPEQLPISVPEFAADAAAAARWLAARPDVSARGPARPLDGRRRGDRRRRRRAARRRGGRYLRSGGRGADDCAGPSSWPRCTSPARSPRRWRP